MNKKHMHKFVLAGIQRTEENVTGYIKRIVLFCEKCGDVVEKDPHEAGNGE